MSETNPPRGEQSGTDRLRGTAEEARAAAAGQWEETRGRAEAAAEEARRRAEGEAERGRRMGADQVHRWASALDRAAAEFEPGSMQGDLLRQASEGLDDVAGSIDNRSIGEIVETVADFGRRNPVAFLGGAMVAGFALSRFATASAPGPGSDRPAPPPGAATRAPGPAAGAAGTPPAGAAAPGAETGPAAGQPDGSDQGEELRLTESMRPTTEPGGPDGPRPAAGSGRGDEEDRR